MAETLTGSQRLRAFITGKVERITELEGLLEAETAPTDFAEVTSAAEDFAPC